MQLRMFTYFFPCQHLLISRDCSSTDSLCLDFLTARQSSRTEKLCVSSFLCIEKGDFFLDCSFQNISSTLAYSLPRYTPYFLIYSRVKINPQRTFLFFQVKPYCLACYLDSNKVAKQFLKNKGRNMAKASIFLFSNVRFNINARLRSNQVILLCSCYT